MICEVAIYSQNDLERACRKQKMRDAILISIGNPRSGIFRKEDEKIPEAIRKAFDKMLRLEFHDAYEGDRLPDGKLKRPPTKKDLLRAIRFYEANKDRYSTLVVHCWAGTSRSTAIAICMLYLIHGNEDKVIEVLKEIRPYALPHKKILEYIDELYGTTFQGKRTVVLMNYKERIQRDIEKARTENEGLEEV
jgi:predicted protein tyrosine phosphatase